jgi:hypothetical protein
MLKHGVQPGAATLVLCQGEVLGIVLGRGRVPVTCRTGRIWATVARDPADRVLEPGETVTVRGPGKLVLQALRTSTVRVVALAEGTARAVMPARARFRGNVSAEAPI